MSKRLFIMWVFVLMFLGFAAAFVIESLLQNNTGSMRPPATAEVVPEEISPA